MFARAITTTSRPGRTRASTCRSSSICRTRSWPVPFPVYNVIAEIPGTEKPEEVVIISAHMDSWNGPGSHGHGRTTGPGTSVTIEAARILAAVGAQPKRTIRFALWGGEEQGLLGSKAYIESLSSEEELANISAAFVDDGGTNYEGWYPRRRLHGGVPGRRNRSDQTACSTPRLTAKHLNVNIRPDR